ncbi:MAG: four helix bundle protein, partial [Saprospiraceae bacterium]
AWKLARELSKLGYKVTGKGEFAKDFGFKNQMRNAAGSSMDNIAEDYERDGTKEFINLLTISKGSAGEVCSQAYPDLDVGHITKAEFNEIYTLATRVGKANNGLIKYLKDCELKGRKYK